MPIVFNDNWRILRNQALPIRLETAGRIQCMDSGILRIEIKNNTPWSIKMGSHPVPPFNTSVIVGSLLALRRANPSRARRRER